MKEISTKDNQNLDLCWYCGKNKAQGEYKYYCPLYKILKRKNTFMVVGSSIKTEYIRKSIVIPRCKSCQMLQSKNFNISIITSIALYLISFYIIFLTQNVPIKSTLLGGVILGFIFIPILFLIVSPIVDRLCGSNQGNEKDFPPISMLLADGWEIGTKPPYKGGNIN